MQRLRTTAAKPVGSSPIGDATPGPLGFTVMEDFAPLSEAEAGPSEAV